MNFVIVALLLVAFTLGAQAEEQRLIRIPGGTFQPIFQPQETAARKVRPFLLDRLPVSVGEFELFVKKHPQWRRSSRNLLMTDSNYLQSWRDDSRGVAQMDAPITEISWFAARAFCRSVGKRLPTTAEWEFAALASESAPDGRNDAKYLQRILQWYSAPRTEELVSRGQWKNYYGIYDLHGLVWEWVSDFNNELTTGESRGDSEEERNLFCGAGALAVNEKSRRDYAAFMRYGFRGSLQGRYSMGVLGFRCAKSAE